MITIALIKQNNCNFDKMDECVPMLLYTEHTKEDSRQIRNNINDYIWSIMVPHVEFINVPNPEDSTTIMTTICNNIIKCMPERKADEFFYHTKVSYSFPKKYLELVCADPLWKEYTNGTIAHMNNIGSLFSIEQHVVENSCIILANEYIADAPHFRLTSVTNNDLLSVIRRRYFFSAEVVRDDNIFKYYYQSPSFLITRVFGLDANDKIQKVSTSLFGYNLVFYFQHDKSKYINKIATRLNGLYRLHGDVLVLHEMSENIFANLSTREIRRLNVLAYGRLCDRKCNDDNMWNKYVIVNNNMQKFQKKCIKCEKQEVVRVCDKCYRANYCSDECEVAYKDYHSEECINPKSE